MDVEQFAADGRTTINWTSGTSTEIFIYPTNAYFAERNFLFRISTATVEAETSTFTFFEGITRHLMILKGELELVHEGRYTKRLQSYDQDTFSGEWDTHSKGKVTDFNLMLKKGATGSLMHYKMEADHNKAFTATTDHYFIFIDTGTATMNNDTKVKAQDLLWIKNGSTLVINAQEPCDLIIIEVSVNGNNAV